MFINITVITVPFIAAMFCLGYGMLLNEYQHTSIINYMAYINRLVDNIQADEIKQHLALLETITNNHMKLASPSTLELYCAVIRKRFNL